MHAHIAHYDNVLLYVYERVIATNRDELECTLCSTKNTSQRAFPQCSTTEIEEYIRPFTSRTVASSKIQTSN